MAKVPGQAVHSGQGKSAWGGDAMEVSAGLSNWIKEQQGSMDSLPGLPECNAQLCHLEAMQTSLVTQTLCASICTSIKWGQ